MADPLVVLVLVAASGASEPATSSMTAAARQALGAGTVLLFEERASLPSEAQALALAERVRAGAVVEVDWVGPARTHAVLHVHTAQGPDWAEREIDFGPGDPPGEYGRTIGFAFASMITRLRAPPASPDHQASPPPPADAPRPGPQPSASPSPAPASPPSPASPAARETSRGLAPVAAVAARRAVEVTAAAGTPPGGIGAAAAAFVSVLPSLAAQLSGGLRFGSIPAARATFSTVQVGGGATWKTVLASGPRPLEAGLRADVFATELVVYRDSASRSRWVPEARLEVESAWFFVTSNVGLVLAAGVEATFGSTAIAVGNDTVTTILPFRAVGTLGLRVRF